MPRVTRAALRSNAVFEDEAASVPLPLTPCKEREVLHEVAGNSTQEVIDVSQSDNVAMGNKKGTAKGRKGKVGKKNKKLPASMDEGSNVEVLEDDNHSTASSAVEEACEELMRPGSGDINLITISDPLPITPSSEAVNAAVVQSPMKVQTPPFDPEVHKAENEAMVHSKDEKDDSFVEMIASRTPLRKVHGELSDQASNDLEGDGNLHDGKDDQLHKVVRRTPAVPANRIEDSVEAIDALEDALEKVDQSIPNLIIDRQSPVKLRRQKSTQYSMAGGMPEPTLSAAKSADIVSGVKKSATIKASVTREKSQRSAKGQAKKPPGTISSSSKTSSVKPPKTAEKAPSFAVTPAPAPSHKRVSSLHKAPFQPVKSTKPPTRPSFELPGEAISRKLKEAREECLKLEEEEKVKKRDFKARPVRLSQAPAPVVRTTLASKARMNMAKDDSAERNTSNDHAPKIRPLARTSSAGVNKRLSTLTVPKSSRSSVADASSSAICRPSLTSSANKANQVSNKSSPSRPSITPIDAAQQKLRGKEIFGRAQAEREERERARKEKEEGTKRARAEAAERGRVASREWAERQKVKKEGEKVAVA